MTAQQALMQLEKIPNVKGRHCLVKTEMWRKQNGDIQLDFAMFVADYDWVQGSSWEECLSYMRTRLQ